MSYILLGMGINDWSGLHSLGAGCRVNETR